MSAPAALAEEREPASLSPSDAPVLTVSTKFDEAPYGRMRVRLRAPLRGQFARAVERLRATRIDSSDDYLRAFERAFTASGAFTSVQASALVTRALSRPRLRISEGIATLTTTTLSSVLWDWDEGEGRRLMFESLEVAREWRVELVVDATDAVPRSAYPLPTSDDGNGRLRWHLSHDDSPAITIGLPSGRVAPGSPLVKAAASAVAPASPFLLLLILLRTWPRSAGRPDSHLRSLALAGLTLAFGLAAFFVVEYSSRDYAGLSLPMWAIRDAAAVLLPALAVVAYIWLASPRTAIAKSVALTVAVGLCMAYLASEYLASRSASLAGLLLGSAFATALVAMATNAMMRRLVDAFGDLAGVWGTRAARLRMWVPALVIIVLLAEALVATNVRVDGLPPSWDRWRELEQVLYASPSSLARVTLSLTVSLFGISLAVWSWRRVGDGEMRFATWHESFAFALPLAMAVGGWGGYIGGYPAPLAFGLLLMGASAAAYGRARTSRARLALDGRARVAARELLLRAVELRQLRRRKSTAVERLLANEIDDDDHDRLLRGFDERREGLLQRDLLRSVDRDDRERTMRTLGLAGEAGARGRLSTVARRGWWLVAIPVAYSAYAVLDQYAGFALSGERVFGAALLFSALTDQILIWPIAAWCFIVALPLVPGSNGPWKGLVAGLFCAVSLALPAPLLDDAPARAEWLFLSAQLTLMFTAIGVVLDYRSVRQIGGDLRQLGELYDVTTVRAALAYVGPLALLVLSIIQGIAAGSGGAALEDLAANASSLLPSGR